MKKLLLAFIFALPLCGAVVDTTTFEAGTETGIDISNNVDLDSTDQACSGLESAEALSSGATGVGFIYTATGHLWHRAYLRIGSLPASQSALINIDSTITPRCTLALETDGRLTITAVNGTPNTSTATIPTGAWVMIEIECDMNQSAGSDRAIARINGAVAASSTDGSTVGTMDRTILRQGGADGDSNNTNWDDFEVDDAAYPGNSAGCGDVGGGSNNKYKSVVIGD